MSCSTSPLRRAFAAASAHGSRATPGTTCLRRNASSKRRRPPSLRAFVYASSSSVYGNAAVFPTTEQAPRAPVSPYGMTKVAAEELAGVYLRCFGVPVVGLRYFTAFGPRQRPDMAFSRFFRCALSGRPLPINGDGRQVRDFTFVDDVVAGTLAAADLGRPGRVYNIGGASPVELLDAVAQIAQLSGRDVQLARRPAQGRRPPHGLRRRARQARAGVRPWRRPVRGPVGAVRMDARPLDRHVEVVAA